MHTGRMAALLLAAFAAFAPAACALEPEREAAYGGSGEDILYEAVSCGDGLFAVGTTASNDYDLDMRTRSTETGWALRLGSDGAVRFSYCSGRGSMTRMTAPAALEDGRYALVLTDEQGRQGEWIMLDARGKALSRIMLPQTAALCPDGVVIRQMTTVETPSDAVLALLIEHADGTLCCAWMHTDGRIEPGVPVSGGGESRCAAGRGVMAHALVQADGFVLTFIAPDSEEIERVTVPADCGALTIEDMLLGEDESAVLCGAAREGGYLIRVSRAGEVLFSQQTQTPVTSMTETETGFAALTGGEILFADEDGAHMALTQAPENTLDLAPSLGGAAALSHLPERGRRQARFTHIAQPALQNGEAEAAAPGEFPLGEGVLLCSASDLSGVLVTHLSADGTQVFATRTPIHTAADSLQWCCAAMLADGSILLGGRYLTGTGTAQRQQAVCALLSAGGVLRRMETIEGAGAVCAVEETKDGKILLHIAGEGEPSLEADRMIGLGI